MTVHLQLHRSAAINAEYMPLGNCGGVITILVIDKAGQEVEISVYTDGPIAIEGADKLLLLALAAQPADPMVVDGGTFSEERREYFL